VKYENFSIPPPAAVYGDIAEGGFVWSDDVTILRGYLGGFGLANDATSPGTVIDVGAGLCASDDVTGYMALVPFSKTTGPWAAGSGNGGLDTGSIAASTWYHVFVIQRTDTGTVDVLLSQSATSPALPALYGRKRRIGSIRTNTSSQILAFVQNGDEFLWAAPGQDAAPAILNGTLGTAPVLVTLTVPTGLKVNALLRCYWQNAAAGTLYLLSSPDETPVAGGSLNTSGSQGNISAAASFANNGEGAILTLNVRTNTGAQVRAVSSAAGSSLSIATCGWVDTRGRFS
jgi:hypothetical protein